MKNKKILSFHEPDTYVLLLSFFIISAILAAMTMTNRNIAALQVSNQNTSSSFELKDRVEALLSDVFLMETTQRGIILGNADSLSEYQRAIASVENDLVQLQPLVASEHNTEFAQLKFFVLRKVKFTRLLMTAYSNRGKQETEALIGTGIGESLRDSVHKYAGKLEAVFSRGVRQNLAANDAESKRLEPLISLLAFAALAIILTLVTLVLYRLRKQKKLIQTLEIAHERELSAIQELEIAKGAAEDSLQTKESFLANMSHEIRTPITAVLGFSNILQKGSLTEEQQKYVGLIQSSGSSLLSIVNDILDLSKLEAGMVRIEEVPFDLRELCTTVVELFKPQASEKRLKMELQVHENCASILVGDPMRVKQVLTNLLANAIKFTPKGTVILTVAPDDNHPGYGICFTIHDSGIGMSEAQREKLFARFDQGAVETTRKYGGTGLGLAITKNLIELQGGSITVESTPGVGSCFYVRIPFRTALATIEKKNAACGELSFAPEKRVLIVDDNEVNRLLVEYMLNEWGLNHQSAANGKEALELLQQQSFDMVLMDLQMPEMDGYAAAAAVREKLRLSLPIAAMTAHVLPEERERCKVAGMDGYISKPLQEVELKELLHKFIGLPKNDASGTCFIDPLFLELKFSGNTAFIQKILRQVLHQFPDELNKLREAVTLKDAKLVAAMAHKMGSTISILHKSSKPSGLLLSIEKAASARTLRWTNITKLVQQLEAANEGLEREVAAIIGDLQVPA